MISKIISMMRQKKIVIFPQMPESTIFRREKNTMSSLIWNPRWRFESSNLTRPMVLEVGGDTKGYELEYALKIHRAKEERVVEWDYEDQTIYIAGNDYKNVVFAFPSPDQKKMIVIFRDNIEPWENENIKYLVVYSADGREHCQPMLPMTKTPEDQWPYLSPRRAVGCGPILWDELNGNMSMLIVLDMGVNDACEDQEFDPETGEFGDAHGTSKWC